MNAHVRLVDFGPAGFEQVEARSVIGIVHCLVAADDLTGLLADALIPAGAVVHCELVVLAGQGWFDGSGSDAATSALSDRAAGLTDRQRQILDLVAAGLTDLAIAHRLRITARTVGKHLEHIYRRLGVDNRTSAAAWWLEEKGLGDRSGALSPDDRLLAGRLVNRVRLQSVAAGTVIPPATSVRSGPCT